MKKLLLIAVLYLALGGEACAFHRYFLLPHRTPRSAPGHLRVYPVTRLYDPLAGIPDGSALYQSYYTPYRYVGSQQLAQQSATLPLGWNRYYLASRLQAPYSLILGNSPPFSSYRVAEPPEPASSQQPPVSVYTIPLRSGGPPRHDTVEISQGMTEEEVRSRLGQPIIQVVLGDTRSFVYDMLQVEFEGGRVKNVVIR